MTQRIDRLPANQFSGRIAALKADVNELKTRQKTRTIYLKTYLNQTSNSFDIAVSLGMYTSTTFTTTFTGAIEPYSITSLIYRVFVDSTTSEVNPTGGASLWPTLTVIQRPPDTSNQKTTKWDIKVLNNDSNSHTYYFKFYVQSTDTGGVSAA